jgi:hypothetical protein
MIKSIFFLLSVVVAPLAYGSGWDCRSTCISGEAVFPVNITLGRNYGNRSDAFDMLKNTCGGFLAERIASSSSEFISERQGWARWSEHVEAYSHFFWAKFATERACHLDSSMESDLTPLVDDHFVPSGGLGGG